MGEPAALAVVGAGMIGRRHLAAIAASGVATVAAVVDPAEGAAGLAADFGARYAPDIAALLAEDAPRPDGVVVATPNQLHVEHGLALVAAGLPALVEKPIADTAAAAERLVAAAEAAGVPLLVGHHRRHNPLMTAAREIVESGALGRIVAVHANVWLCKPDPYFDVAWRRAPGAGPLLLNLIHDLDLLRWLCGEIVEVRADQSSAVRGLAVEDTAAVLLRFANGALGTVSVSDTVAAPWSWELTAKENPAFPATDEFCALIGGTDASLALPSLALWRHPERRDWMTPIEKTQRSAPAADPLIRQIRHFVEVVRGRAAPIVSGREGLRSLRAVEAVKRAATTGETVRLA